MQPHRVPHSKLKVKQISFSLQKHSVNISTDFRDIDFNCDIERKHLMSSRFRFLVKIEIAALKKNKSLTPEQQWDDIYQRVFENCSNEGLDPDLVSRGNTNGILEQWTREKGKDS